MNLYGSIKALVAIIYQNAPCLFSFLPIEGHIYVNISKVRGTLGYILKNVPRTTSQILLVSFPQVLCLVSRIFTYFNLCALLDYRELVDLHTLVTSSFTLYLLLTSMHVHCVQNLYDLLVPFEQESQPLITCRIHDAIPLLSVR